MKIKEIMKGTGAYLCINNTVLGTRDHDETLNLRKIGELGRVELANAERV
jgi:hypothetical protein